MSQLYIRGWLQWLLLLSWCVQIKRPEVGAAGTDLPPLPVLPIPSAAQLAWQRREMIMFFHFGMNTFTGREWGTGQEDPRLFNPGSSLDANQWVTVAKQAGVSLVILTAKHHDGFCLWPSAYTQYSVRNAPWKNGHGDVVSELATAARTHGIQLGLYLSPWDRHDPRYGHTLLYNQFYMAQLHELLTRYGEISEVWFDGAKGKNAPAMKYMFRRWFAVVHQLQRSINIFSDAGPDVRWVGDEQGSCGLTCWSLFNATHARIGIGANPLLLNSGDAHGVNWVPPECDVSIRPGWFWHKDEHPKTAYDLLGLYYKSVGRNCVLLLNVPPNSSGLLSPQDVDAMLSFKHMRDAIFSFNLASNSTSSIHASSFRGPLFHPRNILDGHSSTFWAAADGKAHSTITLTLKHPIKFNVVELKEPIEFGQRVAKYKVRVKTLNNKWALFSSGTTIGYRKLDFGCIVEASHLQLVLAKSRAEPLLSSLSLHLDMFSESNSTCVHL